MTVLMAALLGLDIGILGCATSYAAHAHFADATGMQGNQQEKHEGDNVCGWIGVAVSPMTAAFAKSLGMAEPYGAIFDQPEPDSPAANAHIEQGDVLTAINGSPLMRSSDFVGIISAMAPGVTVYLDTWRDGEAMQVKVMLGSAPCQARGKCRSATYRTTHGWRCTMLRTAIAGRDGGPPIVRFGVD